LQVRRVIDGVSLKNFLSLRCGHPTTDRELIGMIRRIDLDGDAKINFEEF
jgi:Ca2+-binding EF-hand superfamily protein